MGKKKVIQKTGEEIAKEAESIERISTEKSLQKSKYRHEDGRVYIQASYNNTIITITDAQGNSVAWMSAGSLGFSGPKKSTPFAGSKVAEALSEKMQRMGMQRVEIFVRGVGSGRDAAIRSFAAKGFVITSIKDVTPVAHNGPRPKKSRRV